MFVCLADCVTRVIFIADLYLECPFPLSLSRISFNESTRYFAFLFGLREHSEFGRVVITKTAFVSVSRSLGVFCV